MFYSTSLEYSSQPTNLQSLSTSAETTPKREAKAHEVVNGTGAELDQISLREDMSNHERGMEKTTDHLHRQTVNSKKNCLTWRSKLGQQLELLRQLKTQAISRLCLLLTKAKATNPMKLTVLTRNHNTVGGLGEEALFPVYGMEIIGLCLESRNCYRTLGASIS
ncbi:hypothetical protein Bca101_075570 [Brassica carinata]